MEIDLGILNRLFGARQPATRRTTQPDAAEQSHPLDDAAFQSGLKEVRYLADLLETCDTDELDTLIALPHLIAQVGGSAPQTLVNEAKAALPREQVARFSDAEAAAADMIRQQVAAGFTVFGGRSPREEVASRIVSGAVGIAAALLLRGVVGDATFRRIWAPYRFHLPFLMIFESKWATDERAAGGGGSEEQAAEAQGEAPTIDEIEEHVLFVLKYDMRVDSPELERSLRDEYGLNNDDVTQLVDQVLAKWFIQPMVLRPTVIAADDIHRAGTIADVVDLIAASFGHPVTPTFAVSTTTNRFGPQTDAVFAVLREARWLPLHAGRTFHERFENLGDPEIQLVRKAMAEAMWAARRDGRTKYVKEARRLVDRAASSSVMAVHPDNLSYEAMEHGSSAGQFAIMAVMAAATRDLISPETHHRLTESWKSVVDN